MPSGNPHANRFGHVDAVIAGHAPADRRPRAAECDSERSSGREVQRPSSAGGLLYKKGGGGLAPATAREIGGLYYAATQNLSVALSL